ncbi:MAG: tRNA pseudouridine(38-40) synthase TruA [Thermodesulfobacteriota bacterium]
MTGRRFLKVTLAYDGTAYRGWQRQRDPATIQEVCEKALGRVLGEAVTLHGAGRTDAGVHALGQVASLVTARPIATGGLARGANSLLPRDIRVLAVEETAAGFHARRSALAKRYRYRLAIGRILLPYDRLYAGHEPRSLDQPAMGRCLAALVGEHDFRSFCGAGSLDFAALPPRGTRRRILAASLAPEPGRPEILAVELVGDGFLRHMVRNIVGTLLEVGRGRRQEGDFAGLLAAGDRRLAGPTAPPQGLFLVEIFYQPEGLAAFLATSQTFSTTPAIERELP